MIQEVLPNIFQIKVPLPKNPLGAVNSYLIKGDKRSLLVDTGFNWPECKAALLEGLGSLDVHPSELDMFITHMHGDHSGLVYELSSNDPQVRVYGSEIDAGLLRDTFSVDHWQRIDANLKAHGFPSTETEMSSQSSSIRSFISGSELNFTYVNEGDIIEIGDYRLTCIMTPGHSPGHVCLYEAEHKFLIAGDHILQDISPNITAWLDVEDPLGSYLQSLKKVKKMDIDLVLPGHRGLISDCRGRISELERHHQARLEEVLDILKMGALSAYQVASHMTWDMSYDSWEQFPAYQRWFATGEALAHLAHLMQEKKVLMVGEEDGGIVFQLS